MGTLRRKLASRGRNASGRDGGINDINVTPIIDVALTLVVILLLTSPMALESNFAIRRAVAAGRQANEQKKAERVELNIVSEDSVRVNRTMVARGSLSEALRPLLQESPTVVVECAGEVSHGTFVSVLDAARLCGAPQLAIVGR